LEQSVLYAILRIRNDAYGVLIHKEIVEQTGNDVSVGAIYTVLSRLEEKGFVTSRLGESTAVRGGRAKRYFTISALGQSVLHETERAMSALRSFSSGAASQ
jgi:DNA-binding PadR family transcriptional regulator